MNLEYQIFFNDQYIDLERNYYRNIKSAQNDVGYSQFIGSRILELKVFADNLILSYMKQVFQDGENNIGEIENII